MQTIIIGRVNLSFTILAIYIIDKFGRKPLLLIGTAAMAVCLFTNAWAFHSATYVLTEEAVQELPADVGEALVPLIGQTYHSQSEFTDTLDQAGAAEHSAALVNPSMNISAQLVLFAIMGYIAAFAISLGPVMWALFSEIFPNQLRGVAISFVGMINSMVSFMVQLLFPLELSVLGAALTFFSYFVFAVIGLILVAWLLPETKGKSLEELETMFGTKASTGSPA